MGAHTQTKPPTTLERGGFKHALVETAVQWLLWVGNQGENIAIISRGPSSLQGMAQMGPSHLHHLLPDKSSKVAAGFECWFWGMVRGSQPAVGTQRLQKPCWGPPKASRAAGQSVEMRVWGLGPGGDKSWWRRRRRFCGRAYFQGRGLLFAPQALPWLSAPCHAWLSWEGKS